VPTAIRPSRSLLVLALVANLLAASVPLSAGAAEETPTAARFVASPPVAALGHDADATSRSASAAAGTAATVAGGRGTSSAAERSAPLVQPRPVGVAKAGTASTAGSTSTSSGSFKGRNHVWIPALGISKSITFYSCSSSYYPGNRVYRWGCAGSNNIYLFGHAFSVFRALHDAYVRGRLYKGMKVYYANGAGKVSTFAVSWWKLTTPSNGAWAYAAQSTPSLTLQTCVGSNSQYRLIVRLRKI
jgi:hypothetical protein